MAWLIAASIIAGAEILIGTGHAVGAALAALAVAALVSASAQEDHATSVAVGLAPALAYIAWAGGLRAKGGGRAMVCVVLALAAGALALASWRGWVTPQAWWLAVWAGLSVPSAYVTSTSLRHKEGRNPNVYDAGAGVEEGNRGGGG